MKLFGQVLAVLAAVYHARIDNRMEVITENNSLVNSESRTPVQSARQSRRSYRREQKTPATPTNPGMKQMDLAELFSFKLVR